jgi:hypothetical protein
MRPVAPKEEEGAPWFVSDLIDNQTRSWNRQKLETFFSPMDVEVICNIPLMRVNSTNFLDEGLRIGGRATTRDSRIEIGTRCTHVHVPAVEDRYILLAI